MTVTSPPLILLLLSSYFAQSKLHSIALRRLIPLPFARKRQNQRNPCHTTLHWSWIAPPDETNYNKLFQTRLPFLFNHDFVGITNPLLHGTDYESTSMCSLSNEELIFPPDGCPHDESSHRVIRLRRKIGKGRKCYETVRNAALNWDLHRDSSWAGVRLASPEKGSPFGRLTDYEKQAVMEIWNSPGKRLVTLSRVGGSSSPIWAMNPCMVVYDLVDERGRSGTTYTSTAYATLKGHLLSGEERVSVIIKDEKPVAAVNADYGNANRVLSLSTRSRKNAASMENDNRDGDVYVEILSCSRPAPGLIGKLIFPFVKKMQNNFFKEEMDTLEKIGKGSR